MLTLHRIGCPNSIDGRNGIWLFKILVCLSEGSPVNRSLPVLNGSFFFFKSSVQGELISLQSFLCVIVYPRNREAGNQAASCQDRKILQEILCLFAYQV